MSIAIEGFRPGELAQRAAARRAKFDAIGTIE
jgi:hypothetical protein